MNIQEDISFIFGKMLLQVCFGIYQVQLHFENDALIEIGHNINFYKKDGEIQKWSYTDGRNSFCLNSVLEIPVKNALVDESNNLKIYFESGEIIEILSGGNGYESYIVFYDKDFQVIY